MIYSCCEFIGSKQWKLKGYSCAGGLPQLSNMKFSPLSSTEGSRGSSAILVMCGWRTHQILRRHHENQVVDLCFSEAYDKAALRGGYLAGKVPAADRSNTWRCQHMEIWILLSHNGKYISICLWDEGNNCSLSNITSPRTANSALRLLLKCPACFLSLSGEKNDGT